MSSSSKSRSTSSSTTSPKSKEESQPASSSHIITLSEIKPGEPKGEQTRDTDKMSINVSTLTGQVISIQVKKVHTKIMEIKQEISSILNVSTAEQCLIFGKKELSNDGDVGTYNIRDGANLKLVLKLKGGPGIPALTSPIKSPAGENESDNPNNNNVVLLLCKQNDDLYMLELHMRTAKQRKAAAAQLMKLASLRPTSSSYKLLNDISCQFADQELNLNDQDYADLWEEYEGAIGDAAGLFLGNDDEDVEDEDELDAINDELIAKDYKKYEKLLRPGSSTSTMSTATFLSLLEVSSVGSLSRPISATSTSSFISSDDDDEDDFFFEDFDFIARKSLPTSAKSARPAKSASATRKIKLRPNTAMCLMKIPNNKDIDLKPVVLVPATLNGKKKRAKSCSIKEVKDEVKQEKFEISKKTTKEESTSTSICKDDEKEINTELFLEVKNDLSATTINDQYQIRKPSTPLTPTKRQIGPVRFKPSSTPEPELFDYTPPRRSEFFNSNFDSIKKKTVYPSKSSRAKTPANYFDHQLVDQVFLNKSTITIPPTSFLNHDAKVMEFKSEYPPKDFVIEASIINSKTESAKTSKSRKSSARILKSSRSKSSTRKEDYQQTQQRQRCFLCKKKLSILSPFKCKCGNNFCSLHRYSDKHECTFDFKSEGRKQLVKENPKMREDQINNAVNFLKDPKVQAAPLTKRISFLETKGLTQDEIQEALTRTNNPTTVSPASLPHHSPQQMIQPYNWKDYTLAAISVAGLGYTGAALAQKYLMPLISWPSTSQLDESNELIDTHLKSANTTLQAVHATSTDMMKAVEIHAEKVSSSLSSMQTLMNDLKLADEKRDEEISSIRTEVDSIKEMIPKMLDKSKESQTAVLTDIQNEIKSLKNLLLNRRIPFSLSSTSPVPSTTTQQQQPTNPPSTTNSPAISSNNNIISSSTSIDETPVESSYVKPLKPIIPAWQLEAQNHVQQPGSTTNSPALSTSIDDAPVESSFVKPVKPTIPAWQLEAQNPLQQTSQELPKNEE